MLASIKNIKLLINQKISKKSKHENVSNSQSQEKQNQCLFTAENRN